MEQKPILRRIARNLGILLMNSNCFAISFSNILVMSSDIHSMKRSTVKFFCSSKKNFFNQGRFMVSCFL